MEQKVIILRGPAASGKTTIAKLLCSFEKKTIWLKVDTFKDFFGDSDQVLPYVNGAAIATMKYLLDQGFSVVIDGVFQNTAAISEAESFSINKGIPIKVFELETSLESLKKRDITREGVREGFRKPLGNETIERIYQTLKNNPYPGSIILNTETSSLEQCKQIIDETFQS